MKKKFITISIITILITMMLFTTACNPTAKSVNNKKAVYTTIYPLYDITKNIAGDKLNVINIIPPGVEPHYWEPSTRDVAKISNSNLVIYLGLGMDSWITKLKGNSNTQFIQASKGVNTIKSGNTVNPHIWLSPERMITVATNIKNALIKIDSKNKSYYDKNYNTVKNKLIKLDMDYKSNLSALPKKSFIVYHAAFDYLASDFGLKQIALTGINEEQEPSPSKVAEIMNYIKKHKIKYIFTEPLTSSKAIKTIATDTGINVLQLSTIEGLSKEEIKNKMDYFSLMHENLKNLKKALE